MNLTEIDVWMWFTVMKHELIMGMVQKPHV